MTHSLAERAEAQISRGRTKLPVFDRTTRKLQETLQDDDLDVGEVQKLVERDPALASAVLQLSNTTFYGGMEKLTSVRESILRLGAAQVARLATIVTQKGNFTARSKPIRPTVGILWRHAIACGVGSQWLVERSGRPDLASDAFLAGMMHDIGKLLLLRAIDDLIAARPGFAPSLEQIDEVMSSLHATQGEALMRQWNIPEPYPRIVRLHHEPDFDENDTLLAAVRLADRASHALGIGAGSRDDDQDGQLAESKEARVLGLDALDIEALEMVIDGTSELAG